MRRADGLPLSGYLRFFPLGMALLCVQLDIFSLNLALPTIARGLHVPVTDLQWLVSGYLMSIGAMTVPAGRLGDMFGRRLTLIIGLVTFGVTSLVCGFAAAPLVIIVSRVVQGIGAAIILPTVFALVSNDTTDAERPKAVGFMLGIGGVGTALGPIVGGVFASTVGWQWVFWVNVPLAAIAIAGATRVADSRNESLPRSLRTVDWWGLVTIVAGLTLLSLGIDAVPDAGWFSPFSTAPMLAGLVLLAVFAVIETRAAHPLVRPSLLRVAPYRALLLVGTVANTGLNVMVLMATFDLQNVRGNSPDVAGLLFLLGSIGVGLAGPIGGWLCSRFAVALVAGVSTALGGLSLLLIAGAQDVLVFYVIALGIGGVTCAMSYTVTQIGVQTAVPPQRGGEANSFLLMVMVSLAGVFVVVASGVVEGVGAGRPTVAGIDAVLVGTTVAMVLTGLFLVLRGRLSRAAA